LVSIPSDISTLMTINILSTGLLSVLVIIPFQLMLSCCKRDWFCPVQLLKHLRGFKEMDNVHCLHLFSNSLKMHMDFFNKIIIIKMGGAPCAIGILWYVFSILNEGVHPFTKPLCMPGTCLISFCHQEQGSTPVSIVSAHLICISRAILSHEHLHDF
jgi:hypothetical protein